MTDVQSPILPSTTLPTSTPPTMTTISSSTMPINTTRENVIRSVQDILAGTCGGLMTVIVGHPLDTIKVRLQTASSGSSYQGGMLQCVRHTFQSEGIRGFYKGMQSPLAGEGFFNAVQFFAWGWAKEIVSRNNVEQNSNSNSNNKELTIPQYILAGAMTGFFSSFIECPIDLFKSQLQTQIFLEKPLFLTLPGAVTHIYHINGVQGWFQGLGATLLRTTPATAFYFGTYEGVRELLLKPGETRSEQSSWSVLLAGGLGGMAYWTSSFALDSIKSSIQADAVQPSQRKYKSIRDCASKLYADGGIARFYRGIVPCLIRSFPANAACFFTYEYVLSIMQKYTQVQ